MTSVSHAANLTVKPSIFPQGPSEHAQDSQHVTFYHHERDPNVVLEQNDVQVHSPPSYPPTRQDWEDYRAIFTQLYRTEDRSLKEVMSIMANQYKFKATPRMFKMRVTDWKLNKNYKAAEREAVARVVEQYRNHGDPIPTILVRGQPVKMHRIQRHCKIGQSLTSTFRSAGYVDSSALNNEAGQIRSRSFIMDVGRTEEGNLPKMASRFAIPLRQLSPPGELKHAEIVLFQMKVFYEWYAQFMVTQQTKGSRALDSEAGMVVRVKNHPSDFVCKVSAALELGQRRAGWRILNEAMDMIKPMLASKHPYCLKMLLRNVSQWEDLSPDLYRVIWRQISEMASIVLGDSDPLSKVCFAIPHIKAKGHVYDPAIQLLASIFERNLGPCNFATLEAKSNYTLSLVHNAYFGGAERLQRMVISHFEKLGHEYSQEVVYKFYILGYILGKKGDFSGAKKVYYDALQLSRVASKESFPTQADLYIIRALVSMLTEDEYLDGEALLQEVLSKCLKSVHWGRYDWRTVFVLGWLEYLLTKQEKFYEAVMLRLQYTEAF